MYEKLSQLYKLPALNSKAITIEYLLYHCVEPCSIFRMPRDKFIPPYISTRHVTSLDILEKIEELLKSKNLPESGIDPEKLPDFEWIVGVYFYLDPNDKAGLFKKIIKHETEVVLTINPE